MKHFQIWLGFNIQQKFDFTVHLAYNISTKGYKKASYFRVLNKNDKHKILKLKEVRSCYKVDSNQKGNYSFTAYLISPEFGNVLAGLIMSMQFMLPPYRVRKLP